MVKLGVRSGSKVSMCRILNSVGLTISCAMVSVAPDIGLTAVRVPDTRSKDRKVGSVGCGLPFWVMSGASSLFTHASAGIPVFDTTTPLYMQVHYHTSYPRA